MGVHHVDGPVAQVEQMAQWLEGLPTTDRETRDKIATNLRAAAAALSAAEKERNGSKPPATQEEREGEARPGVHMRPKDGRECSYMAAGGFCNKCGWLAPAKREGDVIEKLREWVEGTSQWSGVAFGHVVRVDELARFLDSISSEEGHGDVDA